MNNTNELIFVNNILNTKLTIRKAAKSLGLRRDDLIKKIKDILKNDEENIKKLDLIIIANKIIFDNLSIKEAANKMKISEKELDKQILKLLQNSKYKKEKYERIRKNII